MGVRDRDAVAGPLEQLDVVLAVAERDRPRRRRSRAAPATYAMPLPFETSGLASSRKTGSEVATKSRSRKRPRNAPRARAMRGSSSTATSFVGGRSSHSESRPTAVTGMLWKPAYRSREGVQLRHVQVVVDVAVDVHALLLERDERLAGELDVDRDVAQEPAAHRLGDEGALVADDRVVDAGPLRVRADGAEHPAGHDHERDAASRGRPRSPRACAARAARRRRSACGRGRMRPPRPRTESRRGASGLA